MSGFNKDYSYGGTFTYGGTGIYGGVRPQERISGLDSTHIERKNDAFKIDKSHSEGIQVVSKQESGLSIVANIQAGEATNPEGLKYDATEDYDGNFSYDVSFMSGNSAPVDIDVVFTGVDGVDII